MNIKTMKYSIFLTLSLLLVVFCQSCKKNDVEAETDRVRNLLIATSWRIKSVTVDGVDQTAVYAGLVLNFTGTDYTTLNGGVIWPAIGTWKFSDDSGKNIVRNDGLNMSVSEASTTKIILTFNWDKTTLNGGRVESIKGQHIFTFEK